MQQITDKEKRDYG